MGLYNWFEKLFDAISNDTSINSSNNVVKRDNTVKSDLKDDDRPTINPATGLPMIGDVDVQGNPYGTGTNYNDIYCNNDDLFTGESSAHSIDNNGIDSSMDDSFDDNSIHSDIDDSFIDDTFDNNGFDDTFRDDDTF